MSRIQVRVTAAGAINGHESFPFRQHKHMCVNFTSLVKERNINIETNMTGLQSDGTSCESVNNHPMMYQ